MSLIIIKTGRMFGFIRTNKKEAQLYFHCKMCGLQLNGEYSEIILRFMNAELIDTDYETLCCSCFFIKSLMDNYTCPKCHKDLVFHRKDHYYITKCTKCKYKKKFHL